MPSIDPGTLSPQHLYNLITTAVTPRPVAWVSTLSADGVRNLAAFSYFNAISTRPPLVAFSVGVYPDGGVKDTLNNLRAVPECVVHIADGGRIAEVEISGTKYPPDVDEFAQAGLTPIPADLVRPARIAEARIALECKVHEIHPLPAGSRNTLIICEVLRFHVADGLAGDDYLIDVLKLDPISRLGRKDMGLLGRVEDGQAAMDAFLRHTPRGE